MGHLSDLCESMRSTTAAIDADVSGLPAELIHWHPAAETWSIMDNICHIVEFVPYWTNELQTILRDPAYQWGRDHNHAARLAAVADTSCKRLEEVLPVMRNVVSVSAEVLAVLPEDVLNREALSRNPRWGVKPVSFIVEHLLVTHLQKHRGQIQRNVRQFGESRQVAE